MQAYNNDEALKVKTIVAMKDDIAAERLVKGHYWNTRSKNGCFIGCVTRHQNGAHQAFEETLQIPRLLARLGDCLFEGLEYEEAKKFTIDFLEAIKPGVDLSGVWPKFAHFMLVDPEHGVIKFAKTDRTKKSIQDVASLYQRTINGEVIDRNAWLEARSYAAADAAAYAAADAAADAAAYAAAYAAAAYAAAAYAAAAYAAAAYAAARRRHYAALAARLIELFKEAV